MAGEEALVANGVECMNCSEITEDEDPDGTAECEVCGEALLHLVRIDPCEWTDAAECPSDDHHYGRGDHVRSVGQ